MNFGAYWFFRQTHIRMYKAQEVRESQAPQLYAVVKNLALKAGLPMPKVYIVPGETPNAFATGRNRDHAVVAVTEGILRILNREELEGVLAHELSTLRTRTCLSVPLQQPLPDHRYAGEYGPVGGYLRRFKPRRQRGRKRRYRSHRNGDSCTYCGNYYTDGNFQVEGIPADEGGPVDQANHTAWQAPLKKLSKASQAMPMDANLQPLICLSSTR